MVLIRSAEHMGSYSEPENLPAGEVWTSQMPSTPPTVEGPIGFPMGDVRTIPGFVVREDEVETEPIATVPLEVPEPTADPTAQATEQTAKKKAKRSKSQPKHQPSDLLELDFDTLNRRMAKHHPEALLGTPSFKSKKEVVPIRDYRGFRFGTPDGKKPYVDHKVENQHQEAAKAAELRKKPAPPKLPKAHQPANNPPRPQPRYRTTEDGQITESVAKNGRITRYAEGAGPQAPALRNRQEVRTPAEVVEEPIAFKGIIRNLLQNHSDEALQEYISQNAGSPEAIMAAEVAQQILQERHQAAESVAEPVTPETKKSNTSRLKRVARVAGAVVLVGAGIGLAIYEQERKKKRR